jgi:predicted amidohydrolase
MTVADSVVVAAVQFSTGLDVDENLATCLRMIDRAAEADATLIVLPEFINHLSVYESAHHCREVAVDLDGPFVRALAERAARHQAYVVGACTVRRPDRVTVTSLMVGPDGHLVGQADKQTLMGNERRFLSAGPHVAPVFDLDLGTGRHPVGMYACMDGVTPETPLALTVRGATILTNSLNSFAKDEASLHIPVRAAENGVYVVAASKVGPLLPPQQIEAFSEAMGLPPESFDGAGESQIVDPDGRVLAIGPTEGEAVVTARIALPNRDSRLFRDGPHPVGARRPEIYGRLAEPAEAPAPADAAVRVAVVGSGDPAAIGSALADARLVVLPELTEVPSEIPPDVWVVSTRRDGDAHVGEVYSSEGLVASQLQLHFTPRHDWATRLGDGLDLIDLPFGRLALLVGDDCRLPEPARLAAVQGANLLAVPTHVEAKWVDDLGLTERAAENRLCLAAATRPTRHGTSILVDLPTDFTLWAPDRDRPFDGTINYPDVARATVDDSFLVGDLHLDRTTNRCISKDTDLVDGRAMASTAVLLGQA